MKPNYKYILDSNISGIPCQIGISNYVSVAGNPYTWDSDADYYGYTEMEWDVLDRKGYHASWLERKLDDKMRDRIETEIDEFMSDLRSHQYWY